MINYLALLVAIALSIVAAYYSIVGLAVIFASAIVPVVVMGSTLELAKVVAASWLYRNWTSCPKLIKYYLTSAVVVLMFITSMGIFGFLSKAHIDQGVGTNDNLIVIKNIEREIQSEEAAIRNAQTSIDILDRLVSEANPRDANFIRNRQKREREALNAQIRTSSDTIKNLNQQLAPIRKESARLEAEVGPIRYVADLVYGESDQRLLEKAVRLVIIIIVLVFDPLAIALLLAANYSLGKHVQYREPEPTPTEPPPSPKAKKQTKKVEPEVVVFEEKEKWDQKWFKRAKELIKRKRNGIIEIDKNSIVRMK